MHDTPFIPKNAVEEQLVLAQNGEIPGDLFMQEMLQSELFMPVYDNQKIAGFQNSKQANPLILQDENNQDILILFTSPERAKDFVKDYPGYHGGLLADLKWILEKMGNREYAISLNPNWSVGLDMESDMVDSLRQQ